MIPLSRERRIGRSDNCERELSWEALKGVLLIPALLEVSLVGGVMKLSVTPLRPAKEKVCAPGFLVNLVQIPT